MCQCHEFSVVFQAIVICNHNFHVYCNDVYTYPLDMHQGCLAILKSGALFYKESYVKS